MTLALRLLALVAVLLLPLGMATAPAEMHHAQTAATMPTEHCPDGPSKADAQGVLADCTMACSSALPASDVPPAEALSFARSPVEPALAPSLAGRILEIATPPPRLS